MTELVSKAKFVRYAAGVLETPLHMFSDEQKLLLLDACQELELITRTKAIEDAARVAEECDTLGTSYHDHELTPDGMIARNKVRQIAKSIRALTGSVKP